MSLEQALTALTVAVKENTAAMQAFVAGEEPSTAKRGPGRPRKDAMPTAANPPPVGTAAQTQDFGPALPGDADGTSYFASRDAQSVAKFAPTDSLVPVSDRTKWEQISGELYAAKLAALEAKKPAAASAQTKTDAAPSQPTAPANAAPAESATNTSTTVALSYESVRASLLGLAQSDPANGRSRILAILKKAGVNSVPELADKPADVLAQVAAEIAGKSDEAADPLFG
jgi:hypothetical protein